MFYFPFMSISIMEFLSGLLNKDAVYFLLTAAAFHKLVRYFSELCLHYHQVKLHLISIKILQYWFY